MRTPPKYPNSIKQAVMAEFEKEPRNINKIFGR